MKVKVISRFRDKYLSDIREVGEILEVSNERAEELFLALVAEPLESPEDNDEVKIESQEKESAKEEKPEAESRSRKNDD